MCWSVDLVGHGLLPGLVRRFKNNPEGNSSHRQLCKYSSLGIKTPAEGTSIVGFSVFSITWLTVIANLDDFICYFSPKALPRLWTETRPVGFRLRILLGILHSSQDFVSQAQSLNGRWSNPPEKMALP